MEGYKKLGDVEGATREIMRQVGIAQQLQSDVEPQNIVPHVCVDEGALSKDVWDALKFLVSCGRISGGSGLRDEHYLDSEGKPVPPDFPSDDPWKRARTTAGVRRIGYPDKHIALGALGQLYISRRVILLSEDLGVEQNGLRWLLKHRAAPEFDPSVDLGFALLLKPFSVTSATFAQSVIRKIETTKWERGYSEILLDP